MTLVHSNVHVLPIPLKAPPGARPRTVTLNRLDGQRFASAGFLGGLASDPWTWIAETVAHELSVEPEDVGCLETDDGDMVTVFGLPVYQIQI